MNVLFTSYSRDKKKSLQDSMDIFLRHLELKTTKLTDVSLEYIFINGMVDNESK